MWWGKSSQLFMCYCNPFYTAWCTDLIMSFRTNCLDKADERNILMFCWVVFRKVQSLAPLWLCVVFITAPFCSYRFILCVVLKLVSFYFCLSFTSSPFLCLIRNWHLVNYKLQLASSSNWPLLQVPRILWAAPFHFHACYPH